MSDYIIHDGELYHFGVLGMRWGKRKTRYVTAYQSQKKATIAAQKARRESIAESRASGDNGIGSFHRANRRALNAKRKAYGESIAADRAYNRQLKSTQNADKKPMSSKTKTAITIGATAAVTALAAYGVHKLSNKRVLSQKNKGMKAAGRALAKFGAGVVAATVVIRSAPIVADNLTRKSPRYEDQ